MTLTLGKSLGLESVGMVEFGIGLAGRRSFVEMDLRRRADLCHCLEFDSERLGWQRSRCLGRRSLLVLGKAWALSRSLPS